ncbi:MAG: recombinase RecT [Eubacteriales bacterium]|nr:recombinase RecT [Eubacteriales bacterium]
MADPKTPATNELAKRQPTPSERFAVSVERQFAGEVGQLNMTDYEKSLAQHLFIKIDAALIEADKKRANGNPPIVWQNVNMRKLAIDAVHRVQLGLDALIPGHIYPIAYLNGRTKQYDIDLRVGYKGEEYYSQRASVRPIVDMRTELVYSTDEFTVYKKGVSSKVEGYDFKVTSPFDRGELVGGFVYIEYADGVGNELVVMSRKEIDKIKGTAQSDKFWGAWYDEMAYKTLIHKATKKIVIDPHKINVTAYATVEAEENAGALPAADYIDEDMPALELHDDGASVVSDASEAVPDKPTEGEPF